MHYLKKLKFPLLTILFSAFVILMAKAATPYQVSVEAFNDSEFPRIQATLKIKGDTEGLLPKHLALQEGDGFNFSPIALLPPHPQPNRIDLNILLDTSSKTASNQHLIKSNLKGLVQYLNAKSIDTQVSFSNFQDTIDFQSENLEEIIAFIDQLDFDEADTPQLMDGFAKIASFSQKTKRPEAQKVMLIINGSRFQDTKQGGGMGVQMKEAVAAASQNNDLTFVIGHPLQQMHHIKADAPSAELIDFSHHTPGGYLGGFGADLSSLGDLLLKQSSEHFVFQYYTNYPPSSLLGAQTNLLIDGAQAAQFNYQNAGSDKLTLHHLPENELAVGDLVPMTVDLEHFGKAINAVELNYKNHEGQMVPLPLIHERSQSTVDKLSYKLALPDNIFSGEYFTYFIKVHTPYTSTPNETGAVTIPVNIYDDGIILEAKLSDDKKAVLWSWSGPTVEKGKAFEVWMGDTILETTDQTNYAIPLDDCNRYQILQIQVIFPDDSKSHPSRPFEFFVDGENGETLIKEKEAVDLMMQCLQKKRIESYLSLAAQTPELSAEAPLSLEKTGLYLIKILHPDLWEKVKIGSGYYELILYIMKFLNKDQYLKFGIENTTPVDKALIYKLISKANHTQDLQASFDRGLSELSARVRGNLTF